MKKFLTMFALGPIMLAILSAGNSAFAKICVLSNPPTAPVNISWASLNALSTWDSPHFGDTWEAITSDGAHKVSGVAACLATNSKNGKLPSATDIGSNCWCKVSFVDDSRVSGAWVFNISKKNATECYGFCAHDCVSCIRIGSASSCTRAALFAPL